VTRAGPLGERDGLPGRAGPDLRCLKLQSNLTSGGLRLQITPYQTNLSLGSSVAAVALWSESDIQRISPSGRPRINDGW
jgi:hypothetical protein